MSGVRLAFYGTGEAAFDHAEAARQLGAIVHAGSATSDHSPRWQAFHRKFPDVRFEPNPSRFAERNDIDAIVVALPWDKQDSVLDWALHCPKPVLIEKPIASTAPLLRAALTKNKSTLSNKLVGYNRRYYSTVERVRCRLQQGGLRAAEIRISEDARRLRDRRGAGILPEYLLNSSCHILDTAISLLGPLDVVAMTRSRQSFDGLDFDNFNGMLQTGSGVAISFNCNAYDPVRVGLAFRFIDGTYWCLTPPERLSVYQGYSIVERGEGSQVRRYEPRVIEEHEEDATVRPGFLKQMKAFLRLGFGPGCTPPDALHLLDLVNGIRTSARAIGE